MTIRHELSILSDTTNATGPRRQERRVVLECDTPCNTVVAILVASYTDEPPMVDAMIAAAKATHGVSLTVAEERGARAREAQLSSVESGRR